ARGTLRAMARRSDTRLLVLHWLRLKGQASVSAVAESAEIATAEVESWLARLAADGLVVHRDVPEGWSLTPAGGGPDAPPGGGGGRAARGWAGGRGGEHK